MNISRNQRFLYNVLYPAFHWVFRVEFVGTANIPIKPYIVASNHLSLIDPFLYFALKKKDIQKIFGMRFIVAAAHYDKWYVRTLLGPVGAIRGQKIVWSYESFFAEAAGVLAGGEPLTIYVEGGRNSKGSRTVKPGIGYISSASSCPVLPMKISRKNGISYRVVFGKPYASTDSDFSRAAQLVYRIIEKL